MMSLMQNVCKRQIHWKHKVDEGVSGAGVEANGEVTANGCGFWRVGVKML